MTPARREEIRRLASEWDGAEALDALNEAINAIGARGEGSPT